MFLALRIHRKLLKGSLLKLLITTRCLSYTSAEPVQDKVWSDSTPDLPERFDPQKAWSWKILQRSRTNPGAMIRRMKYYSQGRQKGKEPLDEEEKKSMLNFFKGALSYALQGNYMPTNDSLIDIIQTYINLGDPLEGIKIWMKSPDLDVYSPVVKNAVNRASGVVCQICNDPEQKAIISTQLVELYQHLHVHKELTTEKILYFMRLYNAIGAPEKTTFLYRLHRLRGRFPLEAEFFALAIQAWSTLGSVKSAQRAFNRMSKAGVEPDDSCHANLIKAYLDTGQTDKAWNQYQSIDPSQVILSSEFFEILIISFTLAKKPDAVVQLFKDMTNMGYMPSPRTLRILTNVLGEKVEVTSDSGTSLSSGELLALVVRQYSMHGHMEGAIAAINQAIEANVAEMDAQISYEVIVGFCRNGNVQVAQAFMQQARDHGIQPLELAYRAIAKCYVDKRNGYVEIMELIDQAQTDGLECPVALVNLLIQNHVSFRRNEQVYKAFQTLRSIPPGPNEVTYSLLFSLIQESRPIQKQLRETNMETALVGPVVPKSTESGRSVLNAGGDLVEPRQLFAMMYHDLKVKVPLARYIEAPVKAFFRIQDYPALLALLIHANSKGIQLPELSLLRGISRSLRTGGSVTHQRRLDMILKEIAQTPEGSKPRTLIKLIAGLMDPKSDKSILDAAQAMQLELVSGFEWIWRRDQMSHEAGVS